MERLVSLLTECAVAGWLPAIFEHGFMARGLIAALIIGPVLGAVGTVVLARRLVFFTQTIGSAALTGVSIGLLLGEPEDQPVVGLFGFCLALAVVLTYLRNRTRSTYDTMTGVVLAQTLGLGIVLLVLVTKRFNIHQVEGILFGSLITLTNQDLWLLLGTALLALVLGLSGYNRIIATTLSPPLAGVRGMRPLLAEYAFIVVLTLVITASLKMVGALLVLVLIVLPAAGARVLAGNLAAYFWWSVALGLGTTVGGLFLAGSWEIPAGGATVTVGAALYYAALLVHSLRSRLRT